MPRKRSSDNGDAAAAEPIAKRRSARQAAAASTKQTEAKAQLEEEKKEESTPAKKRAASGKETKPDKKAERKTSATTNKMDDKTGDKPTQKTKTKKTADDAKETKPSTTSKAKDSVNNGSSSRAVSEDPDVDSIPTMNPDAPRHQGEWYWLMKAEPETRLENGIDVSFSIDDLRAKDKPEGWDGIRAYAARNHMRNMNAGDKAFFYHSNCKEPGIAGIMEIVKEYSEDSNARRPGGPYYDPSSTKDNVRWNLVHVEFRKKFAVPIGLKELRELGKPGGPLENMQMLKQSRLSVSRVSKEEWETLCEIADKKAKDAGLEHQTGKLVKRVASQNLLSDLRQSFSSSSSHLGRCNIISTRGSSQQPPSSPDGAQSISSSDRQVKKNSAVDSV
ncbi:Thymocyte nuclear protein 1 [Trichoderma ghanense]|uniref:Thymocyte nuclear protein 1 n=1 Tax=Trichoderma ghanense TaxID=65468 RepID=A0ABY2HAB0_9HYPO